MSPKKNLAKLVEFKLGKLKLKNFVVQQQRRLLLPFPLFFLLSYLHNLPKLAKSAYG
jgi:hypothetical protein